MSPLPVSQDVSPTVLELCVCCLLCWWCVLLGHLDPSALQDFGFRLVVNFPAPTNRLSVTCIDIPHSCLNCCASSSGICFSHHLTVTLGISNFSLDFGCIRHHNKRVAYHVLETIVFHRYMFVAHITLQPCVCWLLNLPVHFMMTGPGLETLELYPYIWNKHF